MRRDDEWLDQTRDLTLHSPSVGSETSSGAELVDDVGVEMNEDQRMVCSSRL